MSGLTDADFAALLRARRGLRRFFNSVEEAARGAGITPAQHRLLLAVRGLRDPDGPRIRDLADILYVAHHTTVELVDRTAAAGLVERHPDRRDQRVVRVRLTGRGEQVLAALTETHVRELRQLRGAFAGLTETLPGRPAPGPVDGGTPPDDDRPVVVERVATADGELVLRRAGPHFEVVSNGVFLMDTRSGRSEQLLVRAALGACGAVAPTVLIGGLGVGFSLLAALAAPVERVTVVELEPVLLDWHATHLAHLTGAALADRRVRLVRADVADWLAGTDERYDAVCLDVDNGPDWTVRNGNHRLYGPAGTALLAGRLRPGGALAVWSASAAPAYERLLQTVFGEVTVHQVPVARGEPDVVFVARSPRTNG